MIECPACKTILTDNSRYCSACGFCLEPLENGAGPSCVPSGPNYVAIGYHDIPDYLVWSILELCLCCLPLGIVGLIYSIDANNRKERGDYVRAMEKAKAAKKYLIWGIALWGIAIICYIAFYVIMLGFMFTATVTSQGGIH